MVGPAAMDKSVHPPVCWIGVGTLLCRSVDGGPAAMDKSVHPPVCWIGVGTLLCRSVNGGAGCDGQECPSSCLLDRRRYTLVPQCQWWGWLRWTRVSILLFAGQESVHSCAVVSSAIEAAMDRSVHAPVDDAAHLTPLPFARLSGSCDCFIVNAPCPLN